MVKKRIIKRRTVSQETNDSNHQSSDAAKHLRATKAVQQLYDKNPDTSVYARRYQYKKQENTEEK